MVTRDITKKWTAPIREWKSTLNQLAIRIEDWFPF
jgi:transposase-like protein